MFTCMDEMRSIEVLFHISFVLFSVSGRVTVILNAACTCMLTYCCYGIYIAGGVAKSHVIAGSLANLSSVKL